ncbi:MAG: hypothetical protein ACM3SQ_16660 [Betaproteobacteria bacterium]
MSDERIDRLIDEVARERTAGAPSGAFRASVLARLGEAPRRRSLRAAWLVPGLAVAVALLVVAYVVRVPPRQPETLASATLVATPTPIARPKPPAPSAVRPSPGATAAARLQPRGPLHEPATTSPGFPTEGVLAPPAKLQIASIAVEPLEPASTLDVQPLQTSSIEVAPLADESLDDFPKERP